MLGSKDSFLEFLAGSLAGPGRLLSRHLARREAWRSLKASGGREAVLAMQAGFHMAEQYRRWDAWSLDPAAILWVAELACRGRVKQIVELGAGYSTIALSEFFRQYAPYVQMDSFEHQPEYAQRIRQHLPIPSRTTLHCAELLEIEDTTFEALFQMEDAYTAFIASSTHVPESSYQETRLRNSFYRLGTHQWESARVDLLIVDGPNGNGRSLAFPLMRQAMRLPGWALIDDYLDYPFVEYMQRVFHTETVAQQTLLDKEHVLVRLMARK